MEHGVNYFDTAEMYNDGDSESSLGLALKGKRDKTGLDLLKRFPEGKPWFMVVNFTGPHSPFDVTRRMREAWDNVDFPLPVNSTAQFEATDIRRNYAAMLENITTMPAFY